jgi:penicillin-binding protein 1A
MSFRWWTFPALLLLSALAAGIMLLAFAAAIVYPTLPSLDVLTDYHPKIPLRVYSGDGKLIGEFGEERRAVVSIKDVPQPLINAIVAAEDERFYQHRGVDYVGVARAAMSNFVSVACARAPAPSPCRSRATSSCQRKNAHPQVQRDAARVQDRGEPAQGPDPRALHQPDLSRAEGLRIRGGGQIYFGKRLTDLTLAESALLAGLPKAPSRFNPVANPQRARLRQQYVLRRMRDLQMISENSRRRRKSRWFTSSGK